MKLEAIKNKLVVELLEPSKPKAGQIITEEVKGVKKRDRGTVISVGKKVEEIKVGDVVTFNQYAGKDWEEDGDEVNFVLLTEDEVYAKLTD